jgi:NAD(P)-dependent dehydrogenase (short-subunit alcohol dehydrogenase family)
MIDSDSSRIYFGDDFERVLRVTAARTALKRLPELDEIAAVVALLCTPQAGYLTAQTIMVDGGLTLSSPLAE